MTEVWLHSNRRVLLLAMVPAAVLAGVSFWVLNSFSMLNVGGVPVLRWLGMAGLGIATLLLFGLIRQLFQPRIAYKTGNVLFFLKARGPIRVPINVVEAFFQGEGPAHLPGESQQQTKSVNLIARLSQRETDWQQRNVKPALGCWAEGYVTVRGTWCEPITDEVIRQLNRRLSEVTRAAQAKSKESAES